MSALEACAERAKLMSSLALHCMIKKQVRPVLRLSLEKQRLLLGLYVQSTTKRHAERRYQNLLDYLLLQVPQSLALGIQY